jgi:hypothetical protein
LIGAPAPAPSVTVLLEDDVGLEDQVVVAVGGSARVRRDEIGADEGEVGAGEHLEQEVEAVVELVVAERAAS